MEQFEKDLNEAKKKIYVADHMLSNAFSLLKDPKILLAILDNVHECFSKSLSAFLYHERLFKRIPAYAKNPESELTMFKLKVYKKYGFDDELITTFDKIRDLLIAHNASPVEFSRKDSYVIASNKYDLKTITPEETKKFILDGKKFLNSIEEKIKKTTE